MENFTGFWNNQQIYDQKPSEAEPQVDPVYPVVAIDFAPLVLSSDVSIPPSAEVENLGLIMDSKLNFHAYVSDLRRNCFSISRD